MLETKPQQRYFATVIVLIIILGLVSFWGNPGFRYVDTNDYSKPDLSLTESKEYLDYLATIQTDPEASKKLFETILTEEDVRKEVVAALQSENPVIDPTIEENKIKVSSETGGQAVTDYIVKTVGQVYAFNNQTAGINQNLMSVDLEDVDQLKKDLDTLTKQVYSVPVPKEALGMQKALLTSLAAYEKLVEKSKQYNEADYTSGDEVWPTMYQSYAVSNEKTKIYADDLNYLAGKYQITQVDISQSYAEAAKAYAPTFALVPTAHALFGIGDITFSTTIGDIPRIIMDGVEQGIQASFLQFMGTMLGKLIEKIEQNYMISNFLYYTDALVSGQYTNDYLNKYASSTGGSGLGVLDQQMIKTFIPQLSCGKQPANIENVLQAKAQSYLGFDPENLDPNDPDYYNKLSRVGSFLATPSGWKLYYQDMAQATQSASQKAAAAELNSPGLKTPRDVSKLSIKKSINSVVQAEAAGFNTLLQMGSSNAKSLITSVIGKLVQNLINNFVFSGITGQTSSGGIGVLKEQASCVDSFLIAPVIGTTDTVINKPSTISANDAKAIACSNTEDIDSECTENIVNYLNKCLTNSNASEIDVQCASVAGSIYIETRLQQCIPLMGRVNFAGNPIPPPTDCTQLQDLKNRFLR